MAKSALMVERIRPSDVMVGDRRRPLNDDAVERLMASMSGPLGLKTPITVRVVASYLDPVEGEVDGAALLVTGRHRLEAAVRLGWEHIDCIYTRGTEDEARMWEIAENLHRAELTALERSEQISEWVRLAAKPTQDVSASGGRGNEGGIRAASRDLGINREDARRASVVDKLTSAAKQAARDVGLDDNRSALLEAAKVAPEQQAARISEIAAAKAVKAPRIAANPLNDPQALESQVAALMAAWNRAGPDARQEFLLRIDQPVFDRGAA